MQNHIIPQQKNINYLIVKFLESLGNTANSGEALIEFWDSLLTDDFINSLTDFSCDYFEAFQIRENLNNGHFYLEFFEGYEFPFYIDLTSITNFIGQIIKPMGVTI